MAIETLFLAISDPRSSIVESGFDCRISGVLISMLNSDARKPMYKMVDELLLPFNDISSLKVPHYLAFRFNPNRPSILSTRRVQIV